MEPVTLEMLAEHLRRLADLLDGCAASGGDMTSMIETSDGYWLIANVEMARGESPLTVYVEEGA